jgi:hypothetical protein
MAGAGTSPSFSPFTNPVNVTIAVGDDSGTTSATFRRHGSVWTFPK